MRIIPLLVILLLLSACSSTVKRPVMGDRSVTPKAAVLDSDSLQTTVLEWGGVIVEPRNLQDSTEIQIIAYPLQKNGQPDIDKNPTGRFIAVIQGYLETADYSTGRQVTLSGQLKAVRPGKVGEADYQFPLLQAREILLWPTASETSSRSRVHFGIGVGSGGRSSMGIGIGF